MSQSNGKDFVLTDYARNLIQFKARQLSKRYGFSPSDQNDLQQELWLALLKNADQFDPARASLDTFIDRVINSAAGMIIRARRRLNRSTGCQKSLDIVAPTAEQGPEPISASISQRDLDRRTGLERRTETDRVEEAEAVEVALAQMPTGLSDVCRQLMGGTVASAARNLDVSRRQIRKVANSSRDFFKRAGIDKA